MLYVCILTKKLFLATFSAIFSQTHLVTLLQGRSMVTMSSVRQLEGDNLAVAYIIIQAATKFNNSFHKTFYVCQQGLEVEVGRT
jgi:hypothetical protein